MLESLCVAASAVQIPYTSISGFDHTCLNHSIWSDDYDDGHEKNELIEHPSRLCGNSLNVLTINLLYKNVLLEGILHSDAS